jgi:betaine-aldehyde dehydrogenase
MHPAPAAEDRPSGDPRPLLDLICGVWEAPTENLEGWVDDPNTGEHRQPQVATSASDVDRALGAATRLHASGEWESFSLDDRLNALDLFAAGLDARSDEIAREDAMSTGTPLRATTMMAGALGPRVRAAAAQLVEVGAERSLAANGREVRILHRPLGPAVVIAPWNAPTFVAVAKVASALAAGCPVVLKPAEWTPLGCQIVAEILAELDLPRAAFQLVHGAAAVGGQLAGDPRVRGVCFTGGGAAGRAVAKAAIPHMTALQLELGGLNPVIVRDDADVEFTAKSIVAGMTTLNGQWCEAPGKVLVLAGLHDDLVDAMRQEIGRLEIGHCLSPATDVGPLAYRAHRARLLGVLQGLRERGAELFGADAPEGSPGWFLNPGMVVGLPAAEANQELFGPIVTVHAVASEEEAAREANGPETGLTGFVYGRDTDAALRTASRIVAGEVRVNGAHLQDLADGSEQTFWNSAGIGGHGPTDMIRFFQGRRIIGVDDPTFVI